LDEHQDYEALCITAYPYHLGTISFLELIERLETALDLDQAEALHLDETIDERERE
jgi:hypothetical protein